MSWGYVWICLLFFCFMTTAGWAVEQTMPVVSVPSVSITSVSGAGEQTTPPSEGALPLGGKPVIQATNKIVQGDIVFIGEQNLDISGALNTAGSIAWWQSGNSNPAAPDAVLLVSDPFSFQIEPTYFAGKTGEWYQWMDNQKGECAFTVTDPSLSLRIWDASTDTDVTDTIIPMGNLGNFIIESNLSSVMNRTGYSPEDSSIRITISSPSGDLLTYLTGLNGAQHPLTNLQVNLPFWYWLGQGSDHSVPSLTDGWNTSATYLNGTRIYQPGVYTIKAECNVNGMKDAYKAPDGSDYVNKTVSMTHTVTLADDTVAIEARPGEVIPGESFATVITGLPHHEYYLWMKNTSTMTGQPGDQPPLIAPIQEKVMHDDPAGPYLIGEYVFSDGAGASIREDVPHDPTWNGTQFYGMVKLDATGTRTVYWNTSTATRPGTYTPSVEKHTFSGYVGDSCTVSVNTEKQVTIQVAGSGPYMKGSVASLSGLNRITDTICLFMTGPGIPAAGGSLSSPLVPVQSDVPASFDTAPVSDTDTWTYSWTIPRTVPSDGTYVLYAASHPKNLTDIAASVYDSVPVQITSENTSSIQLVSGWNFISTPKELAQGHNTMAIFSCVNSSGHSIFTYDKITSEWVTMKAEDPFSPLHGFWIYSVSPMTIPLISENTTITPVNLVRGWNSIGITVPDRPASTVLGPLGDTWSYLVGYNGSVQQYTTPLVYGDPAVNTTMLHTKEGFWLYLKENQTFSG